MSPISGEQPRVEPTGVPGGGPVRVRVRFWASARAAVGAAEAEVLVPVEGSPGEGGAITVAEVIGALTEEHGPAAGRVLEVCSVLVDGLRVDRASAVDNGAELEFLPPFAGG